MNLKGFLSLTAVAMTIGGCATMPSHDQLANSVEESRHIGGIPQAIQELDASAKSPQQKAELLFNMERGQLLRLNKDIEQSTGNLLQADAQVNQWESMAKTNPTKLAGMVGASLVSERLATYEGRDYEKVWLTMLLAMNRLSAGDLEAARVDIKRTHEREAVIAEYHSKSVSKVEQQAANKGNETQIKSINGYPVETLDDPEVLALKNGYQNALGHYLAGFIYEVNNDSSLASAGYRKAIELSPKSPVLEAALADLDKRTSGAYRQTQTSTDVLFIVEAGSAPARVSNQFTVPIVLPTGVRTVSFSYPVIRPSTDGPLASIMVNGSAVSLSRVVDVNVMARRELRDEMPGLIARNVTRAVAKGIAQNELEKHAGMFGSLVGAVASAMTEKADDRIWRTLPGRVYLARASLPPGDHRITVAGRDAGTVTVTGRHAVVPVRVMDDSVLVMPVSNFGKIATPTAAK